MVEIARREGRRPPKRASKTTNTQSPSSWVGCLSPDSMCEGVDCGEYDCTGTLPDDTRGCGGGEIGGVSEDGLGFGAGAPKSRRTGAPRRNSGRHWRHVGHRLLRLSQVRRHSRQKRWPQPASTEASPKFSKQMGHVPGGAGALPKFALFRLQCLHDAGSSLADRRRVRFGGSNHGLGAGVAGQPQHEAVVRSASSQLPLRLAGLRIVFSHRLRASRARFRSALARLASDPGVASIDVA